MVMIGLAGPLMGPEGLLLFGFFEEHATGLSLQCALVGGAGRAKNSRGTLY